MNNKDIFRALSIGYCYNMVVGSIKTFIYFVYEEGYILEDIIGILLNIINIVFIIIICIVIIDCFKRRK